MYHLRRLHFFLVQEPIKIKFELKKCWQDALEWAWTCCQQFPNAKQIVSWDCIVLCKSRNRCHFLRKIPEGMAHTPCSPCKAFFGFRSKAVHIPHLLLSTFYMPDAARLKHKMVQGDSVILICGIQLAYIQLLWLKVFCILHRTNNWSSVREKRSTHISSLIVLIQMMC